MEEQVAVIYAGVNGYLDALPVNRVRAFEDGLLGYCCGRNTRRCLLSSIRDSRDLSPMPTRATLKKRGPKSFTKSVLLILFLEGPEGQCPRLKDLRNRIASVKATQKITKAMQMVAAAKLRRAQSAAEAARPYAQRMEAVLANLAGGVSEGLRPGASGRYGAGSDASSRRLHRRAWFVRRL